MEKEVTRDPVRIKAYARLGTSFALYVPLYYTDKFKTAGGALTWSGKIFLPKDLKGETKLYTFMHELVHHMFKHLERGVGRHPIIWNIAADHVVHCILVDVVGVPEVELRSRGFLFLEGAPRGPVEVVYRWLMQRIQAQINKGAKSFTVGGITFEVVDEPSQHSPGKVRWKGRGHSGKGEGEVAIPPSGEKKSVEGSSVAREEFFGRKSKGSLPSHAKREYERSGTTGVNWKLYIQQKISSILGERSRDFTYTKIPFYSRAVYRRGIRLPGVIKKFTCLCVGIDTSGSISHHELSTFMTGLGELTRIVNDLHVWVSDAKIHHYYHNPVMPVEVSGGGGTDFRPVFEDIEKRQIKPTMLVYFTDTFGDFPENPPPYPVLWVVVETEHTLDPKVPFGSVIVI